MRWPFWVKKIKSLETGAFFQIDEYAWTQPVFKWRSTNFALKKRSFLVSFHCPLIPFFIHSIYYMNIA